MLSAWGAQRNWYVYYILFFQKAIVHNKTWKWFHDLLSSESWKSCPNLKCASDSGFRHYFRHVFGHWNLWFVCEGLDKEHALDRLLHGHIFATETRKLGSWKRSVLSCVENGACVHVCLSYHEFGALFVLLYADRLTKQTINRLWRRLLHRQCLRTVCPTTQRVPVARLWLLGEREIWLLEVVCVWRE